jgi:predicted DNA-binding antitoxin AbrB/MazE fold protein
MTANIKAIYENGVLRLKEALPIPEGAQVDVTVTLEENSEESLGAEDPSWDALKAAHNRSRHNDSCRRVAAIFQPPR